MGVKILGLSASLRNARRGAGNKDLIDNLTGISLHHDFMKYLKEQMGIHVENFIKAGSKQNLSFDVLYRNLKKQKGNRGLSNSEGMLAAALWAAQQLGATVFHYSLKEFFSERGQISNVDILKEALINADGILISTPVYFGDRGSLVQSFIDWIRDDDDMKQKVKNKIFGGLAVGAKRNGGQETTLIYQLWDMVNLGFLGIGNDSETTAQYGGTGHAGDIGTVSNDEYGLSMAMGTGRRITQVAQTLRLTKNYRLKDKPKISFWLLQDKDNIAHEKLASFIKKYEDSIESRILNIATADITRCLACDICPTSIDIDKSYRCIVKLKSDYFVNHHEDFLECDAIVPVALCVNSSNRKNFFTNYQKFMERTRYLRRGDYLLTNAISAPLIFEEIGSNENLAIRILTSTLRHHTILMRPLTIYFHNNVFINLDDQERWFKELINLTRELTVGRILAGTGEIRDLTYNPVGYILSAEKDKEDRKLERRKIMLIDRSKRAAIQRESRLEVG